jgi:4-hydroxy-tetrahydrodipicolinate synthase
MMFKGLYTAIVTPFDAKGNLDLEGLRANIQYQIANRVDGIVVLGTTGESPTLNEHEKKVVISVAQEECAGKIQFIVGTGAYSTALTIEYTQKAKDLGAEAVLVVTPYYNRPTQEGLYRHYMALADAVEIPIIVYNIQGRTCQNLATNTLKRLSAHPNIVTVKEASGNVHQMAEVFETIALTNPNFSILSGDDALTLTCMALGGHGIISVVSNLIPDLKRELVDALQAENYPLARQLHYKLLPLFRGAFIETNPIPIKAMMNACGMAAGPCRLPLCELLPENQRKVEELVKEYELQEVGKR